jgi:hypothetical protein
LLYQTNFFCQAETCVPYPAEKMEQALARFFNRGTRNQNLSAIVQIAIHFIGVVEKVALSGRGAGSQLRDSRDIVRAASAFAALRVPPFRIWHDAIIILLFYLRLIAGILLTDYLVTLLF